MGELAGEGCGGRKEKREIDDGVNRGHGEGRNVRTYACMHA